MKGQLVGFRKGSFTDKVTGVVTDSCTLNFVREPNIRETDVTGNVVFATTVYGDSVGKLPELEVNKMYDCDVGYSNGRYYLNDIRKL